MFLLNLAPERGPCWPGKPRYFYNPWSKNCEKFTYGGCRGNRNRFRSYWDCMSTCSRVKISYKHFTCNKPHGHGSCSKVCMTLLRGAEGSY